MAHHRAACYFERMPANPPRFSLSSRLSLVHDFGAFLRCGNVVDLAPDFQRP